MKCANVVMKLGERDEEARLWARMFTLPDDMEWDEALFAALSTLFFAGLIGWMIWMAY